MAKGQKKSNRETRKPKQDKAKPAAASHSFLGAIDRPAGSLTPAAKGARR
jgi:hypothetical protein